MILSFAFCCICCVDNSGTRVLLRSRCHLMCSVTSQGKRTHALAHATPKPSALHAQYNNNKQHINRTRGSYGYLISSVRSSTSSSNINNSEFSLLPMGGSENSKKGERQRSSRISPCSYRVATYTTRFYFSHSLCSVLVAHVYDSFFPSSVLSLSDSYDTESIMCRTHSPHLVVSEDLRVLLAANAFTHRPGRSSRY